MLRIILKQVNVFQESLYLFFIEYEKAFDRLNPNLITQSERKAVGAFLQGDLTGITGKFQTPKIPSIY